MRRSEVLQTLTAHKNELATFGIKSLAIFGSVARDEARPDSDIDILVEFQGPATFNAYMDLKRIPINVRSMVPIMNSVNILTLSF